MAETERLIGELKEVVMELHRSAGNLDTIIRDIEGVISADPEELKYFVVAESNYRGDYVRLSNWDTLIEKERSLWKELIASIKEKES